TRSKRDWSSDVCSADLPMEIFKYLAEQYDEHGETDNLTFIVSNDISDFDDGFVLDSFVSRGMVKRIITSLMVASPITVEAIKNKIGRASCREGEGIEGE